MTPTDRNHVFLLEPMEIRLRISDFFNRYRLPKRERDDEAFELAHRREAEDLALDPYIYGDDRTRTGRRLFKNKKCCVGELLLEGWQIHYSYWQENENGDGATVVILKQSGTPGAVPNRQLEQVLMNTAYKAEVWLNPKANEGGKQTQRVDCINLRYAGRANGDTPCLTPDGLTYRINNLAA